MESRRQGGKAYTWVQHKEVHDLINPHDLIDLHDLRDFGVFRAPDLVLAISFKTIGPNSLAHTCHVDPSH